MKRILVCAVLAVWATCGMAALPFSDAFASGGPVGWTEWFNTGGSLTCVASDVDWRTVTVNPPSGSDGYFGKSTYNAATYATHGWLAGELTDKDYTVEAKIFVPQVTGAAEPDDFLYQMIVLYAKPGVQYVRLHSQYNNDVTNGNRVRVQIAPGTFAKTVTALNFFTGGDAWHTFKAAVTGTGGNFWIDSTLISGASIDWTVEASSVFDGQFGFGQFIDGVGTRSVYVDAFSAVATAGISDWSQFE